MANQTYERPSNASTSDAIAAKIDMKFEIVVIPVSDIDRAKKFYAEARVEARRRVRQR